jgi:aspartate/methionine/tyrosine aminotransferase
MQQPVRARKTFDGAPRLPAMMARHDAQARGRAMKQANSILSGMGTSIFETMSRLANAHDAINLGQGFPDGRGPADVLQIAAEALLDKPNQYPPMMGIPKLRQAVAAHNKRFYDIDVDWQTETMVTTGATEALAACLFGLIEPGDEVVLLAPLYDSYLPIVRRAGGVPKIVPVAPPDWTLPREALAAAMTPRTKLLLLNSPMNPAGKVFDRVELAFIAGLLEKNDAYAVCDEAYEHIVFDDNAHIPLMTLPGMRERAIRIGSAGKTFSMTGWKVGYVTAAAPLVAALSKAHQFLVFTTAPNLQHAVAYGLTREDSCFRSLADDLAAKRDRLSAGLARIGFDVLQTQGSYFLNAGFAGLPIEGDDATICERLTREARVATIPVSAFVPGGGMAGWLRFCFAKQDAVLDEAVARLARYFCVDEAAPAPDAATPLLLTAAVE